MSPTTLRCELCQTDMTLQAREGSPIGYFHCTGCGRWVASSYREELMRAGTAYVPREPTAGAAPVDMDRIKARLERWMAQLDERDPYHVLGIAPSAPEETVKARFHELAMENHPDRGGDPIQMRKVLSAWETIRRSKRLSDEAPRAHSPTMARAAGRRR
jgi:hypothetical protein